MKDSAVISTFYGFRKLFGSITLLLILLPCKIFGQTDSIKKAAELISPLVEFTSVQKNDNTIDLRASFKAKVNGTLIKLPGLKIEFYSGDPSAETKLGEAMTDKNGLAILNTKAEGLTADTAAKINFRINYAGSKTTEAAEEVLAIKRARLELVPVKGDSVLSVQLKLIDLSTGVETPVAETDLAVFVKRLFSSLKLGEGKTDEAGEVTIEVPKDLPGDEKGNIILQARLQDNELYGNLETAVVQKWGKPVSNEMKEFPRALWSTHPPMWMLITFIVLMTAVWGHYIVIVYELFRLKGEH